MDTTAGKMILEKSIFIPVILIVLITITLLILVGGDSAAAYPPGWTVQTSPTGATDAYQLSVATNGRYIFIAWRSTSGSIWFQRSSNYGTSWEDPVLINDGTVYATGSGIKIMCACNDGTGSAYIWIFYSSNKDTGVDGNTEIWIARSDDLGVTWPEDSSTDSSVKPHRWHTGATQRQSQIDADMLEDVNQVMFVYTEKRNDVFSEVKYGGYIDTSGSIHPASDKWISNLNDSHSDMPAICCNDVGDAFVVWQDYATGGFLHKAICSSYTGNKGADWAGVTQVFYQSNRDISYPQIDWNEIFPVMLCTMKNTDNNQYSVLRAYIYTATMTWRGGDGSDPPNIGGSIIYGPQSVEPHPAVCSPWNSEVWLFENLAGQMTLYDDQVNPAIVNCMNTFGTLTSNEAWRSVCAEKRNMIGIAADDGHIYLRRKDSIAPPNVQLTNPSTGQAQDTYINGDFTVSATAVDNFAITGPDMSTGYKFYNGIRRVHYEYSEDGDTWTPLECSGSDEEENGKYYSIKPPYQLTALAAPLNGKRIKIRACAEDSSGGTDTEGNTVITGNLGYGVSPGWVLVDQDPPGSVLHVKGTKGDNNFYVTFASCSLTSTDPNTAKLEYQLSNTQVAGGATDNWTTYSKPFTLTDGIWTVKHRSIDKAGNVSVTKTNMVKVDTVDPVCSITRPKRDTIQTGYYTDETFRLGGTGTDVNDLTWAGIYVDDKKVYETTSDFNMAYVWSLQGVTEGNHTITVKAKDKAGNVGSTVKNVWIGNAVEDWYFAEGNTLPEFDEYICLMNPGDSNAIVQISFMLENGQVITHERSMRPHQRDTVKVKDYVEEGHHVSTKVHCSDQAIIAERPMYFLYKNVWKGGHNAMGVNVLQKDWYFAEGTTRKNSSDGLFDEWITVMNPSESQIANVTITYMMPDASNINAYYSVAPHSRLTVEAVNDVGVDKDVSAKVSSDIPIVAERPMYFNYHGYAVDGSDVVGTSGPSDIWYFAEGATHPGFQEWLTIQNPNDVYANCKITYMTGSGAVTKFDKVVPPRSRGTVDVLSQVGDNENVSARVDADVPIIAERPIYFIYGADAGKGWDGGEAAMGNPDPSTQYFLAEGCTITNFDTWYTLQNPRDDKGCKVTIEYCFGDGSTQNLEYWIEPHSRLTVNVNDAVQRQGDVSGEITASFPIVIERPMYFNYKGITGGHDAVGFGVD